MARAVLALALIATPAFGDDLAHKGQLELSARFSMGMRAIATYDKSYCGTIDTSNSSGFAPVCTGRSPFAMDLELGYGVARRIDAFVELHLALESDFPSSPGLNHSPHIVH